MQAAAEFVCTYNAGDMTRSSILRNLSYLLALNEHRSFTRAAEALCLSQSALSQKIRQIEEELGAQLFDRGTRGVRLTDFGIAYLEYANRAYRDLQTAKHALRDVRDLSRGLLRIAFVPTFSEYLVAPLVERFHSMYPGITMEITELSMDGLESALIDDQIDLAFGFTDVRSDDIEAEPLFREQIMLVAGNSHPLAALSEPVRPQQLEKMPLALLTPSFTARLFIDSYFRSHALKPVVALQADSVSAVLKIVSRGQMATLLPGAIQFEHRNLTFVPLHPPFPVRTVALLRHKHAYRSIASTAFAEMVDTMLNQGSLSALREAHDTGLSDVALPAE
jgi:LysR family cyn operon transcriptional activator